jgi:hypothetical protein
MMTNKQLDDLQTLWEEAEAEWTEFTRHYTEKGVVLTSLRHRAMEAANRNTLAMREAYPALLAQARALRPAGTGGQQKAGEKPIASHE